VSLYARIAAGILIALAVAGLWWKVDRVLAAREQRGYDRRAQEDKTAADAQASRNRELQRAAEMRYTVAAQTRDRFFVTTVKEISDAAAPLAACPVPEPVRVRLNAANECARGDSPASCGAPVQVPDAN
jgi:hypothetical protein